MNRAPSRLAGVTLVLVIALIAAGWWLAQGGRFSKGGPAVDPMALRTPVTTVGFADGSQLEVFGLSEGEWVDGVMARPSGGWSISTSGAETSSFGPEKDFLQIERFNMNERLSGVRLSSDKGRLVMSLRYLDRWGKMVALEPVKAGTPTIRLSDGAGEWIDGSGPFGADNDPGCRGVVSFAGWPRGRKELVFQALRSGQPPVEFRMKNPMAGLAPVAWTPTPLPQVRSGDYWKMTFSKAWETKDPGKGRCLIGDFDFESDLPENGSFSPVSGWLEAVAGAGGTRTERSALVDHQGRLREGFPMPPDEDQFKFLYRVRYTESYPFPRAPVSFILTGGVVSPDGKTIEPGPIAKKLGLDSFDLGPVETAKDSPYPGSHQFSVTLKGTWKSAADRSAAEAAWGNWKDWMPLVFLNGEEHSSGAVGFNGSNLSSGLAASGFRWSGRWVGELKPGDKVEVGVMPRRADEVFEFVVDRSALSAP